MRIRIPAYISIVAALAVMNVHADTKLAIDLVTVARFDYGLLFGSQLAIQRQAESGEISMQASRCYAGHPASSITEALAMDIATRMTDDELRVAIKFYEGEVGRKYTQHGIVSFYKHYRVITTEQLPQLSETEMAEVAAFSKTTAGNKLLFKQVVRVSAVSEPMVRIFRNLRYVCNLR